MGARSGLYAVYNGVIGGLMTLLAVYFFVSIVPNLSTCKKACAVELLQPGRVMGGQGVCATTNYATAYANVCFDCDASLETVWPCPATSGVSGCSVDSLRPTVSCVGLVNATDLYGRPIVSISEVGEVQRARCLAAIGGTAVAGIAPCITCLARSACVEEVEFYGGGTYLDSAGVKNLCFTTPLRITLQVVVNFTLIVFVGCYTIMAFCLLLNTGLLCSFRFAGPRTWGRLTRFGYCRATTVRLVPRAVGALNIVLLVVMAVCAFLFWTFSVCKDALDTYGKPALYNALSGALYLAVAVYVITCLGGGIFRIYISPEAPFITPPTFTPAKTSGGKPPPPRKRNACVSACCGCIGFCCKLGP